ncbi:MAG: DNA polymerase Y family protein [Proteobacteria bacterium]|nr:DNA polymerase Y family protein [Pseudomonadota bacterium]
MPDPDAATAHAARAVPGSHLWMAVLLPALPLEVFAPGVARDAAQAAGAGAPAAPFAVVTGDPQPVVLAPNRAAHAAGVRRGQRLSAALALAPAITFVVRDTAREAAALAAVATFVLRFTPHVSLVRPAALVADLAASLRLFGGFTRLAQGLADGIAARGLTARHAYAPTPLGALALARARHTAPVFDTATLWPLLAALPLAHFDADPAACELLAGSGITTYGEALALPREGLARRCGPAFVELLDRANGRVADPREPYVPPPEFSTRLPLPVPVHDTGALHFVARRALNELADWLLARGLGVLRLELVLAHERYTHVRTGIPATTVALAFGGPTRTLGHLDSVLRERLVRVELPAPVETLTLVTRATAALPARDFGFLPGDDAVPTTAPLVDRLRARLGEGSVLRVAALAEHRPERAMKSDAGAAAPVTAPATPAAASPPGAAALAAADGLTARTRLKKPAADPLPASTPSLPRPLWLLPVPAPVSALRAATLAARRGAAERIESGWWDGHDVRRDYHRVVTPNGSELWVYRTHRRGIDDGDWYVHGLFG